MKAQVKELFKSMAMIVGGILLVVIGFSLIASFVNEKFSAVVFLGPIPVHGILIPIIIICAGAGLLILGIRETNRGWTLIISSLFWVIAFVQFDLLGVSASSYRPHIEIVITMILIFGLFAIRSTQPKTKNWGYLGLLLMVIPAINHVLFYFSFLGPKSGVVGDLFFALSGTSLSWTPIFIFANFLGYIVVGLITISAQVFPRWVGWFLAISGLLGLITILAGRFMHPELLRLFFYASQNLVGAMALAGYGWFILKQ